MYQHILQNVEKTAIAMGTNELASQNIQDGLQLSLKGKLELLLATGFSDEEKLELKNLGISEEDIAEIIKSLAYYNDHYHHATAGFPPEKIEWFHSIGLSDEHIAEMESVARDHYTEYHTNQKAIKQQQTELMYVQVSLSMAALQAVLNLKETDKGGKEKGKNRESENLLKIERKLLTAIRAVSEDQPSLEHVKAYSKQVYKAAEQLILNGNTEYFVDFFIGLQIHCGALTALNGDLELGLAEIASYESALSECTVSSKRLIPPLTTINEQSVSLSLENTGSPTHFEGQVEEHDETNNKAWITLVVKIPDDTMWDLVAILKAAIAEGSIDISQYLLTKALVKAGLTILSAQLLTGLLGAVILLIMNSQPVGGGWVDHVPNDPTGTFDEIIVDEYAVAQIKNIQKKYPGLREKRE